MDKTVHAVKHKKPMGFRQYQMQRAKFYIASARGLMPVFGSRQVESIGQLANNRRGLDEFDSFRLNLSRCIKPYIRSKNSKKRRAFDGLKIKEKLKCFKI